MEIRAYPADYLDNAMVTMATMLDYAVNVRFEHIDYFFHSFLEICNSPLLNIYCARA